MNKLLFLLIVILIYSSCSKSEEGIIIPQYVGKWERIWYDEEAGENFIQILEIDKDKFGSEIFLEKENQLKLHINYNGSQSVVDNTLKVWITRFGKVNTDNKMIYTELNDPNFDELVFENLKIHSYFIGLYFLDNNKLSLVLDFDGDSIASSEEGVLNFHRTE